MSRKQDNKWKVEWCVWSITDTQGWNYNWRYIPKYSEKAEPLTRLTNKDDLSGWESEQLAIVPMITAFSMAPILWYFHYGREVIIETVAFDYVSAGVLLQHYDEGVIHPMAYISKTHSPVEYNCDIYNTELMVIIDALEAWRRECEGACHPLQLLTDYKNVEYWLMNKLLNWRQVQWSECLSHFDYRIVYRPEKSNRKADALMRRSGDLPEWGDKRLKI